MDKIYNTSSKRYVTVNSAHYKKLLKDGYYVEHNQLYSPKNVTILTTVNNKDTESGCARVIDPFVLPNDMIGEIINNTLTSDLFALCQTNTVFHNACKNVARLSILKHNMRPAIALSDHNTFFIKDNKLYGVGSNAHGQLGQGKKGGQRKSSILIPIPNNTTPLTVSCGNDHMLVLTTHGLFGCGHNNGQQLSTQKINQILTLQPIFQKEHVLMMQCYGEFSYILTMKGLFFSGVSLFTSIDIKNINPLDVLMIRVTYSKAYMVTKSGLYTISNASLKLFETYIDDTDILNVSCGSYFVLVLTRTGLYGKGDNDNGQLGLGYVSNNVDTFVKIPIDNVVGIASCNTYSIVLLANGDVYGFGRQGMESGYWAYPSLNVTQSIPLK